MTARDVYERALALIDEVESDGSISTETALAYAGKAPRIIDVLQRELALIEGVTLTSSVSDLDDTLAVSDDTALRVMPYGLAASFALADKNGDMHGDYSYLYRKLSRTIRSDEGDMDDDYDLLGGLL